MKTNQDRENIYRLFREHGDVLGIAGATLVSLRALIAALEELKPTDQSIQELYGEVKTAIRESEPKIVPLIHLLEDFEKEMGEVLQAGLHRFRRRALELLQTKIEFFESKLEEVTRHGLDYVKDGDVIIVHSPSPVVTNILVSAKQDYRRSFKVIVLQQNLSRTKLLIPALQQAEIEHLVIPDYDLSHYIEQTNKFFIGAVTLTDDRKILAPVGIAATVSQCHINRTQVFVFANTLHFSHGTLSDQQVYCSQEELAGSDLPIRVTSHSHDVFDLSLIDHLITEDGEISLDQPLPGQTC